MVKSKPSKLDKKKQEVEFLKALVNKLIYLSGALKYELERLIDEGGSMSKNIELAREDYTEILTALGIETIDPREAKKKQEAQGVDESVSTSEV